MRQKLSSHLITGLLTALLAALLVTPIAVVVQQGFVEEGRFTLNWFVDLWENELVFRGLLNSLKLAAATTAVCLLISIPLALIADKCNFAGKTAWLALLQVPMILPPFVGAIGVKGMLSRNGGINALLASWGWIDPARPIDLLEHKFWACVALQALSLYPITFLNIQAALANIDPALDEAARNLGAGAWRRFWRITLPLMRPGIFAGSALVLVWAFGEIGTPLIVDYKEVAAVHVFYELQKQAPAGDAFAQVVVLLAASVLVYLVGKVLLGRSGPGMMAKATVAAQPRRLGWWGSLAATLPFALVFLLAVTPHIGVVLFSLSSTGMLEFSPSKWTLEHHMGLLSYGAGSGSPGGLAALSMVNSLRYSTYATIIDLVLGFAIAYVLVRRRNWMSPVLDSMAMLPLAVPGLVLAFGYFAMTQGDSPLAFLNPLKHDPTPLLVIAYAVRRLPFLVRSCAAGLEQTSEALEESALNLGASRVYTMWTIVVPLLAANFIAGGVMVFSRSMLEVSDSLILAFDRSTYPITKAIWDLSTIPQSGMETAAALGVWGMGLLIVTILIASLALGKRLGALFRV